MSRSVGFSVILGFVLFAAACHRAEKEPAPPPDARKPVIRTKDELAEHRQTLIRSGRIMPTTAPAIDELVADAPVRVPAAPIIPGPAAIQSDILMVNDQTITAGELIYPLRFKIDKTRRTQTARGFGDWLALTLRTQIQREIGSLLIYLEAMARLDEHQKEAVDKFVERALNERVAREFDGRTARLDAHLAEFGLTLDTYKGWLRRDAVVGQYSREKLLPLIFIRRDELLAEYRRGIANYSTPATRQLCMIEAPFAAFLPEGASWERADSTQQAQARLKAVRHIREARESLNSRPFDEVAREYSKGPHAAEGGNWGEIAMPLKAPFDKLSAMVFEHEAGWTSEPVETADGWYVVHCGSAAVAEQKPFADVQDRIRVQLRERRFNELLSDYVVKLAAKATISPIDPFIAACGRKAVALPPQDLSKYADEDEDEVATGKKTGAAGKETDAKMDAAGMNTTAGKTEAAEPAPPPQVYPPSETTKRESPPKPGGGILPGRKETGSKPPP